MLFGGSVVREQRTIRIEGEFKVLRLSWITLAQLTLSCVAGLLPILVKSDHISPRVLAFTCPADERGGVRVQACQIGDDIQVLAHNANSYSINVDTRTTYTDQSGTHVRSSSGMIAADFGGQIDLIQVRPYHSLKEVSDISIKDIVQR